MRPQDQNPLDDFAYDISEMLEVDLREHYVRALHYYDMMVFAETSIVELKRLLDPDTAEDIEYFTGVFNKAEDKIIELYDEIEVAYAEHNFLPPMNYDDFINYLEGMQYGFYSR